MRTHSIAAYLFVYTEMAGVARVTGRPLGSVPSRRAVCTCSTTPSSWATVAAWKERQKNTTVDCHPRPLLITVTRLVWGPQQEGTE